MQELELILRMLSWPVVTVVSVLIISATVYAIVDIYTDRRYEKDEKDD